MSAETQPTPAKPLPPDPDEQNDDRADWGQVALEKFMEVTGTDLEDAIGDLIADLMHWCDRNGQDFEHELKRARGHYEDETGEEPV